MKAHRLLCVACVALLGTGCAAPHWATAEEEVAVWLSEQPRAMQLKVEPALPEPKVRVRDRKASERAGKGALGAAGGAGLSILYGCMLYPPFGCLGGVVMAPFAAIAGGVAGAASVASVDSAHPIVEAQGARELYQRAVDRDTVQALLTQALLAESEKAPVEHGLRLSLQAESGGTVTVSLEALDFVGSVGEDPGVSLLVVVRADVTTPETTSYRFAEAAYQGSQRPVSEWKADDAKLFREELAAAAQAIAHNTVLRLRTRPSAEVVARVVEARGRRRGAAAVATLPAPGSERFKGGLVGATWEYGFQDRLFASRSHRFTVRAEAMDDGNVLESFEGEGGMRGAERVSTGSLRFSGRRVGPGEMLVELGPYLLDRGVLLETPTGYPLDSAQDWRVTASPVVSEEVSVPAGAFHAVRVQVMGERSNETFPGLMWNTAGIARFRYTAWYAPEVGRYVKARHEQWNPSGQPVTDELVELIDYRAP
jgi:hypothetical protein